MIEFYIPGVFADISCLFQKNMTNFALDMVVSVFFVSLGFSRACDHTFTVFQFFVCELHRWFAESLKVTFDCFFTDSTL